MFSKSIIKYSMQQSSVLIMITFVFEHCLQYIFLNVNAQVKGQNVVQLLSRVLLFATPWTAACQAYLCFTISWNLLKLMSIELVMPSSYLILCHPLLLLPSIFSSIRVFSNESDLCIRRPKYWSFAFSISSSNEYSGFISFMIDLLIV